jgi:hypothetical protein
MTTAAIALPSCAGIRRDGQRCTSRVLCDGTHCYVHSPSRDAERAEARRRGGRNRANTARLRALVPPRLLPVYDRLETALTEVHEGTLDPRVATALASLARAMVMVLTAGELESRVRALEEGAAQDDRQSWPAR